MINAICGVLAVGVLTAFIGGLAYSIATNTGSIAFPVIVGIVLAMAYAALVEEVLTGRKGG